MAGQRPSPSLSPSPSPFLFPSPVGSIPLTHTTTSVKFDPLARSSLEDLLFRIEIPTAKIKHVRLPGYPSKIHQKLQKKKSDNL